MLKDVRKPLSLKTLMAYVIFGMICLTFVFVGLGDGRLGSSAAGGAAAIVNGSVISIAEFLKRVQAQEEQFSMFFQNLSPTMRREQSKALRVRVLDGLIRSELMTQLAMETGLTASNTEILNFILHEDEMKFLQKNGQFQPEIYERFLQVSRMTAGAFENKVRKVLLSQKLQEAFSQALQASHLELQKQQEVKDSKMKLSFVTFSSEDIKKKYHPQAHEVEDFLKNSSETVQNYYDTHGSEFTSGEQVKAKHILIKTKPGDKESESQALEKIKSLAGRAKTEDFGKLALEFSEDPGSKAKKGDLGYFSRGTMMPAFDKAAFSGVVGEVSKPIKTPYGYHIVKVEDKKATEKQPFESVKDQIVNKLIAKNAVFNIIESLREKLKNQNEPEVQKFIRNYKLKWEDTGEFSIDRNNIPKIGLGDTIYKALLEKPPSQQQGKLLKTLVESNGKLYVIKVAKVKKVSFSKESPKRSFKSQRQTEGQPLAGQSALEAWLSEREKTASVQRNHSLATQ